MNKMLKCAFLHASRFFGLFHLSRILTGRALRIVCYHGFCLDDESRFRPGVFIEPDTFRRRLAHLRRRRYPIMGLEAALAHLRAGTLPRCATVLTIDDGFHGVYARGIPLLEECSFPVTVYVATYYVMKRNPVFRLAVQYLFWKTAADRLDLSEVDPILSGRVLLRDEAAKDSAVRTIIRFGEEDCDEETRVRLVDRLAALLKVDVARMRRRKVVSFMSPQEIQATSKRGMDIQLHTHRHRLQGTRADVEREIQDNRNALKALTGKPAVHLCYPSGIWSPHLWPWLKGLGIESATTCDPGLNYPDTPVLGLKRFLDGEDISQIEFEAELAGFAEVLRRIRGWPVGWLASAGWRNGQAPQGEES